MCLPTSGMSCVSLDFSRKPSRGKVHSVRIGSLSWESKISSKDRKFSSIPTPGGTGKYDCVSIYVWIICKAVSNKNTFSKLLLTQPSSAMFTVCFTFAVLAPENITKQPERQRAQDQSNRLLVKIKRKSVIDYFSLLFLFFVFLIFFKRAEFHFQIM